jgi:Mor family transcriptional regulator
MTHERDLWDELSAGLATAEALSTRTDAWPERLVELTDLLADELAHSQPGLADATVRAVAVRLVTRLARELGGASWYWPKPDAIARTLRDLAIWAEHDGTRGDGRGIRGLARRYQLSEVAVWAILRAQRAQHRQRVQAELPLDEPADH